LAGGGDGVAEAAFVGEGRGGEDAVAFAAAEAFDVGGGHEDDADGGAALGDLVGDLDGGGALAEVEADGAPLGAGDGDVAVKEGGSFDGCGGEEEEQEGDHRSGSVAGGKAPARTTMKFMDDSIAHPGWGAAPVDLPAWKSWLSALSAFLLAVLFLSSGVWKITDPLGWAARIVQMQLPAQLSVPLALGVGAAETFAAALLFVPRFRRWGALLAGALLVVFMVYVAAYYNVLRGEECSVVEAERGSGVLHRRCRDAGGGVFRLEMGLAGA
jgi:uncharacterized membrane protein YphA (DoxX/SURF4 family)